MLTIVKSKNRGELVARDIHGFVLAKGSSRGYNMLGRLIKY
jgi:hypothetical protein